MKLEEMHDFNYFYFEKFDKLVSYFIVFNLQRQFVVESKDTSRAKSMRFDSISIFDLNFNVWNLSAS
jgi:hypothetical protein